VFLFHRWGSTLFLILATAPSFGIPYLGWLSPWPAAIGLRAMVVYHAPASFFIGSSNPLWSSGIPRDWANSYPNSWCGWFTITVNTLLFLRRASRPFRIVK